MKWVKRIAWAVGGVLAIVVLLLALGPFIPFSRFTQVTVENASNHDIWVHSIRFGNEVVQFIRPLKAYRDDRRINEYQIIYFQNVYRRQEAVQVWYTELDTGRRRYGEFVADLTPRRRCKFGVILRDEGPELTECLRSDIEDFD